MRRLYDDWIADQLVNHRQMALVMGPRQVGKTTSARTLDEGHAYLNWDNVNDRRLVLAGPDELANSCGLNQLRRGRRTVVLDEIHKYSKWKGFLKGLFDSYGDRGAFVVTGSARMDMYRRGGDSLMGRYFAYRMHPLSVGELLRPVFRKTPILEPRRFSANDIDQLLRFGGFPEPFLKADTRFYNRWRRLRSDQLFREDFRDMTRIHEIKQLEVLAELVLDRAGQLMNYSNLAAAVNCSVDTIRRWLGAFENLYYCFQVKPWHRNVTKSLRKQPKAYLWDWSQVADHGQRTENFVASHLLKACHFWTDAGFGTYELFFLRDKTKREVDFLVTEDGKPWFLVEVKSSGSGRISSNLSYFQSQIGARHAFQLELSAPYVDKDCFQESHPIRVPASTLLSQLV